MEDKAVKVEQKEPYQKPEVLASYQKKELEEAIQPHGMPTFSPGGCGCGSG